METHRIKLVTIVAVTGFTIASRLFATGGDWFESPAKLSDTIEMLPGKSLGEIFLETSPKPPEAESIDVDAAASDVAAKLGHEPLPKLLKSADAWIAQARASRDNDACNLAHDLHDAIAVSASDPAAARDYILWRISKDALSSNIEQRAEAAKGPIKANWLCACGASQFSSGDRTACQKWFDRVIKEFPTHPRAEIAMFLKARCAFSASRAEGADAAARSKAIASFEAFRKKYPRGPYESDAFGWLGALAFDSENYLKALEHYIAQAEVPGHPETLPTAIYNCERALVRVGAKPDGNAAFDLVAHHPRIAMAFAYLVLSAPEADNYDGKWDNPADVKKWRKTMLPRLAAAVAKQKDAYKTDDWKPRYLAILVQAASASGNQAQALQLSGISADQLLKSDDLLFARGVALQRANRPSEAIEAFQKFLGAFPKSPMKPGVSLRLALACQDNHQAGKAIAVLSKILPRTNENAAAATPTPAAKDDESEETSGDFDTETASETESLGTRYTASDEYPSGETDWKMSESSVYPNLSGADEDQIQMLIDALLTFAPLPELEAELTDKNLSDADRTTLRAVMAERYLVAEDFVNAKRFLTDVETQRRVDRLESLTKEAVWKGAEKADKMAALGNAWADARGLLLRQPLGTRISIFDRQWNYDPLTKRDNGVAVRHSAVEDELDDFDELHHAARWWMRAARLAPKTPLAAKCRLLALESIPKIARASLYGEARAREIGVASVSREIYDKLQAEAPASAEAHEAAYWSVPEVPLSAQHDPWVTDVPVRYSWPNVCSDDSAPRGYQFSDGDAFEKVARLDPFRNDQRAEAPKDVESRVKALRTDASGLEPKDLLAEVQSLADDLRSGATGPEDAGGVNCMEDLAQFLSEPGVSREAAEVYVNLRLDILHRTRGALPDPGPSNEKKDNDESVAAAIDDASKNQAFASLQDYLDFCRMGLVSGARFDVETDIKDPKDEDKPVTVISRDYKTMQTMARDFLKKYPKSKKREAAAFVLARATYAASCPYYCCIGSPLPGTGPLEGIAEGKMSPYYEEPFDSKRVIAALEEYDRAYPKGRYEADIRNLRGATWWRMDEWENALKETVAQITDKAHSELQSEAGVRLANIFAELTRADHRQGVIAAIHTQSAALPYLQAYAAAANKAQDHPLRYLQKFVSDQFHIDVPKSEKESEAGE
jgi:outer membrane protein assembly factor BamD (BamD/ComL family)